MDYSNSIFHFDDTERVPEQLSLDSDLDRTTTIGSSCFSGPKEIHAPQNHLGSLSQKLNTERKLPEHKSLSASTETKEGFYCVKGSGGLDCFLNGQPILFNSYSPAWDRPPSVTAETYFKNSLKRVRNFDSSGLKIPNLIHEYEPKKKIQKVSCLSLAVALRSGLFKRDLALLLNSEDSSRDSDYSTKKTDMTNITQTDIKCKKFYTPEALSKYWKSKDKMFKDPTQIAHIDAFPESLCTLQFYSDYIEKATIRQKKSNYLN